ncbi:retron St85 family effector protein [Billgrantia sp. Q4P2]|uniref:retron St85 family effector protein n=1 Tax=Billgrantia sp. Q4P2 TaxID=3463857 RepID=UPI0040561831
MYTTESTYSRAIKPLVNSIKRSRVVAIRGTPRLFFLCGANESEGQISYRRKQVKEFLEQQIVNSHVIIAESFFHDYIKNKDRNGTGKINSLDFEHVLSDISEKIIIIMESESAICELGAFSHASLRNKLVVINNSEYENSESFINTGPIKAIKDTSGHDKVIWYKMAGMGGAAQDAIAHTFPSLNKVLDHTKAVSEIIHYEELDPADKISTKTLLFVHDLIYLMSEVTYKSLVYFLKDIFGNKDFSKLTDIIAILISLGYIEYPHTYGLMKSCRESAFFRYTESDERVKSGLYLNMIRKRARG